MNDGNKIKKKENNQRQNVDVNLYRVKILMCYFNLKSKYFFIKKRESIIFSAMSNSASGQSSKIQFVQDKRTDKNRTISYLVIYRNSEKKVWVPRTLLFKDNDNKKCIERYEMLMNMSMESQHEEQEEVEQQSPSQNQRQTKQKEKEVKQKQNTNNKKNEGSKKKSMQEIVKLINEKRKEMNEKQKIQQQQKSSQRNSKQILISSSMQDSDDNIHQIASTIKPKQQRISFKKSMFIQQQKQKECGKKTISSRGVKNNGIQIMKARINLQKNMEYQILNTRGMLEWVDANQIKDEYPQEVISFYEKKITWNCQ